MITLLALIVTYLIFCVLVGLCGSQRRMGFTGAFLLSLFLTPVVTLIVLLITGPSRSVELKARSSKV